MGFLVVLPFHKTRSPAGTTYSPVDGERLGRNVGQSKHADLYDRAAEAAELRNHSYSMHGVSPKEAFVYNMYREVQTCVDRIKPACYPKI